MNLTQEHIDSLTYYASTIDRRDPEDAVQKALLAGWRKGDVRGYGWYVRAVRLQALEHLAIQRADRERTQLMGPCLVYEGETVLVPMDRCKRRSVNHVAPVGAGQGFRLADIPCPVCSAPFKPVKVRKGHRKATCGKPKCVSALAARTRALVSRSWDTSLVA